MPWCVWRRIFALRYPLSQGNFGNIDGDNAAAMRYTEARMTIVAQLLLQGIDEDSVDFAIRMSESNREPMVLPSAFQTFWQMARRASRWAWRHQSRRITLPSFCDAALYLITHPQADTDSLLTFVLGLICEWWHHRRRSP